MTTLDFLYKTIPGRVVLKRLTSEKVSAACGRLLSSGISARFVPSYIKKNEIDMTDVIVPEGGFSSFNDFFTRKRWGDIGPVEDGRIISPCDGLMTVRTINENTRIYVKGNRYGIDRLLGDGELAGRFRGGSAIILRLTPRHYHRYCYCVNGTIMDGRRMDGKLHCVRPIALETIPVFTENSREYRIIEAAKGGTVVQMEVGALIVGKINNHRIDSGSHVVAGQEKGFFEFGGSTIILLVEGDGLKLVDERIAYEMETEIPVRMGEYLGRIED